MTKIPNSSGNRTDAALLGICYNYRCNPAGPRLQSAGIYTDCFLARPNLPEDQLKGRQQDSAFPTPRGSRLRERKLLEDPTTRGSRNRKNLVTDMHRVIAIAGLVSDS